MGGKLGVTLSLDQSAGLGNPTHYDINDSSVGMSIWTEKIPGQASFWYFLLPNVVIFKDGKTYRGCLIKLNHGTCIAWDGRGIRHGTSVTISNERPECAVNQTYGTFWAAKYKTIRQHLLQEIRKIHTDYI